MLYLICVRWKSRANQKLSRIVLFLIFRILWSMSLKKWDSEFCSNFYFKISKFLLLLSICKTPTLLGKNEKNDFWLSFFFSVLYSLRAINFLIASLLWYLRDFPSWWKALFWDSFIKRSEFAKNCTFFSLIGGNIQTVLNIKE